MIRIIDIFSACEAKLLIIFPKSVRLGKITTEFILSSFTKFDLCIVKAFALLWALEIARAVNLIDFIIEGDAKLLALIFFSIEFCWVSRNANIVAHCLVIFAASHPKSFLRNFSNLSLSIYEAWLRYLNFLNSI